MTLRWVVALPTGVGSGPADDWSEAIAVSCQRWTPALVDRGLLERYEIRFTRGDDLVPVAETFGPLAPDQPVIFIWDRPALPMQIPPTDGNTLWLIRSGSRAAGIAAAAVGWLPIRWTGELISLEPVMTKFCERMGCGDG